MKVEGFNPLSNLRRKKNVSTKDTDDFSSALSASDSQETQGHTETPSAAESAGLSSLMQLQEIRIPTYTNKAVYDYASGLLEGLDELQQGILIGNFDRSSLSRIEGLIKNIPEGQHPQHIQEILDQIRQRAAIELAKLEMSSINASKPHK